MNLLIIVTVILVGALGYLIYRNLKKKKNMIYNIPQDVVKDLEEIERRYIQSGGKANPFQVIWEVTQRGKYPNPAERQLPQPTTASEINELTGAGGSASTNTATSGGESESKLPIVPVQSDRREDIPKPTASGTPISKGTDKGSQTDNNPSVTTSKPRGHGIFGRRQ